MRVFVFARRVRPIAHVATYVLRVKPNAIYGSRTLMLGGEVDLSGIRSPDKGTDPSVKIFRKILFLPRLAVVEHQPKAVALVSRTLLGAVGDVLAIGRIERSRVAAGIVGRDVLGRSSIHRNDPEVIIGRSSFDLVVVRGIANLLPIRRKSVVILPAQRELRRIVVAGREVVKKEPIGIVPALGILQRAPRLFEVRCGHHKNVAPLAFLVSVPMTVKQMVKYQCVQL